MMPYCPLKPLYLLLFYCFLCSLSSCQPELNFEEPQPPEVKDANRFKRSIRGQYRCLNDSSFLTIDRHHIVREWNIEYSTTQFEIDTNAQLELKDGEVYAHDLSSWLSMELHNDSVVLKGKLVDTLFTMNQRQIARRFKGHYFLNYQNRDAFWKVTLLALDQDTLTLQEMVAGEMEIDQLKAITPIETVTNDAGETISFTAKPSKRAVKSILKSEIFSGGNEFVKIN